MRERACNNCGGKNYEVVGQNMVKCLFCGTLYVDESASKDEEFLLARANDLLREMKFDAALDEFNKIISLYPMSFEGFFGRALAKNKVVLSPNKLGVMKRPCFFDKIVALGEDEDFKKALSFAPPERVKTLAEISRRSEKIKKNYDSSSSKSVYDCILCVCGNDEEKRLAFRNEILKILNKNELSVFDGDEYLKKTIEENVFRALETAKVFVFCALDQEWNSGLRAIFGRYLYLISQHQKTRSSFVLCLDKKKVALENLPKGFDESVGVLDTYSISFVQDLEVRIVNEFENSKKELAKIDTIKIQQAKPKKKNRVDLESVSPADLGHYDVKNIAVTSESKKKWISLALRNGDFQTAENLIENELQEDAYNSELLLAQFFAEKKIRTEDEFFSKISNFSDQERMENILRYANKEFAENFVDRWEKLVQQLDEVEIYNQYLTFLAAFKTPNREDFVQSAENKAVESLDEQLIQNVEKCFDSRETERFENFYFLLAQKTDDKKYYQKILDIDAGHPESNIALMLHKFETPKDKLSHRDREETENMLKFLGENARVAFVSAITELVLPVAFMDLQEAENQLDFYLAYIQDDKALVNLLQTIAQDFVQMHFFKSAEKYISIAISKANDGLSAEDVAQEDKNLASELYWELIKIKSHCQSDEELVLSKIKPTDFPEWETLLELGDCEHDQIYGAIVSKNNLFTGQRAEFVPEMLDRVRLEDKLEKFVERNEKILLEIEKQDGLASKKGVDYFRLQIQPFEKFVEKVENIQDFEEYKAFTEKLQDRLSALGLSLDSSISAVDVAERSGTLSNVEMESSEPSNKSKQLEALKKRQFLKNFLIGFLEFFPLCFATLLLLISAIAPKSVYLYFPQTAIFIFVIFSVFVLATNFLFYVIQKQKLTKKKKAVILSLIGVGILNLLLFVMSFYLIPATMKISTEAELSTLMQNAPYSNFTLESDLDFSGKEWKSVNFKGDFDGKNHKISNLNNAFLYSSRGEVKEVVIEVKIDLKKASTFGCFAIENFGEMQNCVVLGTLHVADGNVVGGFVGKNFGSLTSCQSQVNILTGAENDAIVGGLVGENRGTKKNSQISKCSYSGEIGTDSGNSFVVGGLIGRDFSGTKIFENFSDATIRVEGAAKVVVGGLVGEGRGASHDNHAVGSITTIGVQSGFVGGLYGDFSPSHLDEQVEHSYCSLRLDTQLPCGQLVGKYSGRLSYCFATGRGEIGANASSQFAATPNCEISQRYDERFGFDSAVWDLTLALPKLLWETA